MVNKSKKSSLVGGLLTLLTAQTAVIATARDIQSHTKHQSMKRAAPNLSPNTVSTADVSQISGKTYDYVVVSAHHPKYTTPTVKLNPCIF
jgi:hypothetical protein